jgi:hypothetical protein
MLQDVQCVRVASPSPSITLTDVQIAQFMKNPKTSKRSQFEDRIFIVHAHKFNRYRSVCVLNQTELHTTEAPIAQQLLNVYFEFFKVRPGIFHDTSLY